MAMADSPPVPPRRVRWAVLLLGAGVAGLLWQGRVNADLRAELARLRREVGELERLEATRRTLEGGATEVADLRRRTDALAVARDEGATLQAQATAELAAPPYAKPARADAGAVVLGAPWF